MSIINYIIHIGLWLMLSALLMTGGINGTNWRYYAIAAVVLAIDLHGSLS